MCAGGQYWSGIGRLVFAVSGEQLNALPDGVPKLDLSSRDVFDRGNVHVNVEGPCEELSDGTLRGVRWLLDGALMKGQLNVKTPAQYIAAVDDKRRSDIAALDALIRKHAKLKRVIMGGMLGYGPFHYRYASGREGDACKPRSPATPRTSRCTASPPARRATSPSGTSTGSPRPASARPACGSRSSWTSTSARGASR